MLAKLCMCYCSDFLYCTCDGVFVADFLNSTAGFSQKVGLDIELGSEVQECTQLQASHVLVVTAPLLTLASSSTVHIVSCCVHAEEVAEVELSKTNAEIDDFVKESTANHRRSCRIETSYVLTVSCGYDTPKVK